MNNDVWRLIYQFANVDSRLHLAKMSPELLNPIPLDKRTLQLALGKTTIRDANNDTFVFYYTSTNGQYRLTWYTRVRTHLWSMAKWVPVGQDVGIWVQIEAVISNDLPLSCETYWNSDSRAAAALRDFDNVSKLYLSIELAFFILGKTSKSRWLKWHLVLRASRWWFAGEIAILGSVWFKKLLRF